MFRTVGVVARFIGRFFVGKNRPINGATANGIYTISASDLIVGLFTLSLFFTPTLSAAPAPGDFIWRVETSTKVVCLTFDDGPGPDTEKVLALLKEYGAPSTFFMLGELVKSQPHLAKRVVEDGHEAASHLYVHKNFVKVPPEQGLGEVAASMKKTNAAVKEATGRDVRFTRMPHGVDKPWIREAAKQEGTVLVNWTFGYDWFQMTEEEMLNNYARNIRPGAIILMHDGGKRQKTVNVLAKLLPILKEKGYKMVTLGSLLDAYPPSPLPVRKKTNK